VTENVVTVRVSDATAELIDERADAEGENQSATIRRAIRDGLDPDGQENREDSRVTARYIALVAGLVYVGGWALAGDAALDLAGGAAIVGILAWSWIPELRALYTD
jgi:predicted transcriptional regulator